MVNGSGFFFDEPLLSTYGIHHASTVTPPKSFWGGSVAWEYWEIPIHAASNFFVPLIIYALNCAIFDEQAPPEKHTARTFGDQSLAPPAAPITRVVHGD